MGIYIYYIYIVQDGIDNEPFYVFISFADLVGKLACKISVNGIMRMATIMLQ